jgi:hypothetical protein
MPPQVSATVNAAAFVGAPTTNVSGVAWTWRYENADGGVVAPDDAPVAEVFPTQGDAETWVGETWRELLDSGVDAVSLLEDGRPVYGPMSLHAQD